MKLKIHEPITIVNTITDKPILDDDKNIITLDFKTFMQTIIFPDARWDLSLNHLKMFLNIVDKIKNLKDEIEFSDSEYKIICEIIKQPTVKYNHLYANALIIHADSILNPIICE